MVYINDEGVYNQFKHSHNTVCHTHGDEPFDTNLLIPSGVGLHDLHKGSYLGTTLRLQQHSWPLLPPSKPLSSTNFPDYLQQLPTWEQDYLTNVEWLLPMSESPSLVFSPDALCASDGSADASYSTYGWIISTADATCLCSNSGVVRGKSKTSYRAEIAAVLSLVLFYKHLSSFHLLPMPLVSHNLTD